MNTKTEFNKTSKYPILEMKEKGRLILTPEIINQIMFLHASIGPTEWSGILLYDVVSGDPSKPKDFALEAKHIFLMDIGTAGATEYSPDADIVDMYDKIEGSMEMKSGHVHSHHTMTTFFSATDTDELMTNADKYNYYVSLIVNFSGNYSCKVAFLSEVKNKFSISYKGDDGKLKIMRQDITEKQLVVVNMNISLKYDNPFFYERLNQIRNKIKEAEKKAKSLEKSTQKSFDFSKNNYYGNYSNSTIEPDPDHLTNSEIEHLTRNVLALDTDLTEIRTVYTMLHEIAKDATNEELEMYYEYFMMNAELIIGKFFDNRVLTTDQLKKVYNEIAASVKRFQYIKAIQELVEGLVDTIEEYCEMSEELSEEEQSERTEIDAEFKKLAYE